MNHTPIHLYNDIDQTIACTSITASSKALFITLDHFFKLLNYSQNQEIQAREILNVKGKFSEPSCQN